ncbi:MAG TPA: acyl-ACP--UDP-N-acetylglucosamine O-acyltransferase [Bacteroidales bacterium]|nr:acyl-ACP--UDP-N-acetylglucosamine O-acyltransferase [Bacteroidales bacterium]
MSFHPLTNVHPEAQIGQNVIIEPFATIEKDVIIGDGTWIGAGAVIRNGARIGKNCKIDSCASIAGLPQDLKFRGEYTTVEIGDNTTIREYVTVNRGTAAKNKTVIGNNCLVMSYVHVAHDCLIGNNVILAGYTGLAGEVEIGDWVITGGSTVVHQFVKIGAHAFISGGSLVRKDVPPYVKAAREPLAYVGLNSLGLRRRQFSNETINIIQEVYRCIYLRNMNHSQALEYIETNLPAIPERDEIVMFIRNSKRGIMKGYETDSGDND